MDKRPNILYKVFQSQWMMDPMTASAALKVYEDIVGAARVKAHNPIIEYEVLDDDDEPYNNTYYNYRLTHKNYEEIPEGKHINVVRIEGVMMRDDGWCQPGTRQLADWLRKGDLDSRVIANIIIVDSGGGAADSVKDMADTIVECKKPVIAFCDGYMCSAAYYVASYAKHIMANDKRNMVGCIGTMIQLAGYPATSKDEDGYIRLRIYADGSEDKNSDYEEALKGNCQPIREQVLNPLAEDFRNDVKENRPDTTEDQRRGRTYYAQDVVGSLVDSIGSFKDAVSKSIELSNIKITTMEGLEHLQSIDSCKDLQSVDGCVTLNEAQIADIDSRIAQGDANAQAGQQLAEAQETITKLTQERDSYKAEAEKISEKEATITQLTQERDSLKKDVTNKDARIKTLEGALENGGKDEDPLFAGHNGDPNKPEDDSKEATDEEALDYARKVFNGEI